MPAKCQRMLFEIAAVSSDGDPAFNALSCLPFSRLIFLVALLAECGRVLSVLNAAHFAVILRPIPFLVGFMTIDATLASPAVWVGLSAVNTPSLFLPQAISALAAPHKTGLVSSLSRVIRNPLFKLTMNSANDYDLLGLNTA